MPIIRDHLVVTNDDAKRYARALRILDTPEPLFCPGLKCDELIGSMNDLAPNRKRKVCILCSECKTEVCSLCRQAWHDLACASLEERAFMKEYDIRRCPYCGHLTMKDGGCAHMTCQRCKKHYWWGDKGGTKKADQSLFR